MAKKSVKKGSSEDLFGSARSYAYGKAKTVKKKKKVKKVSPVTEELKTSVSAPTTTTTTTTTDGSDANGPGVSLLDEDGKPLLGSGKTVEVAFAAATARDEDFHAVKSHLVGYLDGGEYNSSELSDLVCGQFIGGVIHTTDPATPRTLEDPVGFVTVVPYTEHKEKGCMKSIREFLLQKAGRVKKPKGASKEKVASLKEDAAALTSVLTTAFNDLNVGLWLHERAVNIPMGLVAPMSRILLEEVHKISNDPKDHEASLYDFDAYLVLAKSYTELDTKVRTFYRDEDALLFRAVTGGGSPVVSWRVPVAAGDRPKATFEAMIEEHRHAMLVPAELFISVVSEVTRLVETGTTTSI